MIVLTASVAFIAIVSKVTLKARVFAITPVASKNVLNATVDLAIPINVVCKAIVDCVALERLVDKANVEDFFADSNLVSNATVLFTPIISNVVISAIVEV